jgi:hypothetical protein
VGYYDEDGKLKNFFLKTPIKFSRLTSRFSNNRYHPVQHRWKAQELIMLRQEARQLRPQHQEQL